MATTQLSIHELGPVHPNTKGYATFETKPTTYSLDGTRDTGGGYEHWRSYEHDPTKPGTGKTDVYASHHRLLAVVACYPDDVPVGDILEDLHGKDVHHTTGVPWANFGASPNFDEPGLEVLDHGDHSSITNTQRRAWAEDARRTVESEPDPDTCPGCGDVPDVWCTSEGFDGRRCLACAKRECDGEPIEV